MSEDSTIEFLWRSNQIEGEHSLIAMSGALTAWRNLQDIKKITLNDIKDIHYFLMAGTNMEIAGKLTKVQTTVGGRKNPPPSEVEQLLRDWCTEYGNVQSAFDYTGRATYGDLEEWIKDAHIAFEHIHPFEDGNGRIGRIIMNTQRHRVGLPIIIVHRDGAVIHTDKCMHADEWIGTEEYYGWFEVE